MCVISLSSWAFAQPTRESFDHLPQLLSRAVMDGGLACRIRETNANPALPKEKERERPLTPTSEAISNVFPILFPFRTKGGNPWNNLAERAVSPSHRRHKKKREKSYRVGKSLCVCKKMPCVCVLRLIKSRCQKNFTIFPNDVIFFFLLFPVGAGDPKTRRLRWRESWKL